MPESFTGEERLFQTNKRRRYLTGEEFLFLTNKRRRYRISS